MAVYRRSSRPRYVLLLLVLTAITLLTLDERGDGSAVFDKVKAWTTDAVAPVQSAVSDTTRPVGDFFAGALHYGDLKKENAHLRDQLQKQAGERAQAADALRENQALKDQQKLDFLGDVRTVPAEVVSTTTSNFDLTVDIDRGTNDGVAKDMPVVASAGLVGRVVRVSESRATVLLITDPSSSVGTRMATSGTVGVATGNGPGQPLRLDYISPPDPNNPSDPNKVNVDEAVVTSGLQGGRFPAGIPVGKIATVSTPPGAVQQEITVRPVVDLKRLQFVQVLIWTADSR